MLAVGGGERGRQLRRLGAPRRPGRGVQLLETVEPGQRVGGRLAAADPTAVAGQLGADHLRDRGATGGVAAVAAVAAVVGVVGVVVVGVVVVVGAGGGPRRGGD